MIRVQKLNNHLAGLFGSSLLAILVSYVPYIGSYLSYAVLVLCLWKCTGADIAPDVVFTVGISGALMFCFNLFVIGALMGDIKPDLSASARDEVSFSDLGEAELQATDDSADADPSDEPAPLTPSPSAAFLAKSAGSTSTQFKLKGVTLDSLRPSAMLSDGSRVHTIFAGATFSADVGKGRIRYRCDEISKGGVVISTGDGERIVLHLP